MSVELVMPKTGLTNTENTLDSWSVSEGDKISKGQQIAEIESEKTTMPFESHEDGIIHLIAKSGDTIAVGGVIALLAADKAEYDSICAGTTVQETKVKKETTTSTDNIANSIELVMPKTGLTNTENTLDSWTVAEGDTISKGQQVAEIESEKTTMPFESHEEGIIHLVAKVGETIAVGGVIALLAPTKEDYEKITEFLEQITKTYRYMGESGKGHLMKIAVNYCSLAQAAMFAQVYPVMKKFGLSEEEVYGGLNNEIFDNWVFQFYSKRYVSHDYFCGFSLNNGIKDLSYMKRLFEECNVPAFVLDGALDLARVTLKDQTPDEPLEFAHMARTMYQLFGFEN